MTSLWFAVGRCRFIVCAVVMLFAGCCLVRGVCCVALTVVVCSSVSLAVDAFVAVRCLLFAVRCALWAVCCLLLLCVTVCVFSL